MELPAPCRAVLSMTVTPPGPDTQEVGPGLGPPLGQQAGWQSRQSAGDGEGQGEGEGEMRAGAGLRGQPLSTVPSVPSRMKMEA